MDSGYINGHMKFRGISGKREEIGGNGMEGGFVNTLIYIYKSLK